MASGRRIVSAEQIVDCYIDLVDEFGPGGPSVRAVAAELFVSPTTLYSRAGPIDEVRSLAATKACAALADEVGALQAGDPAPMVQWVNANLRRAQFATNPHHRLREHDAAVPSDVLAMVGAFAAGRAGIDDPRGLAAAVACLPTAGEVDADALTSGTYADHEDLSQQVLERMNNEGEMLAASARLIATSGVDAWTFRDVAKLVKQPTTSLHATHTKPELFLSLCSTADTQARELTEGEADDVDRRSGLVEACYFALGCHGVERELYPAVATTSLTDLLIRRYAIQHAANTPNPTPAIVGHAAAVFAAALRRASTAA